MPFSYAKVVVSMLAAGVAAGQSGVVPRVFEVAAIKPSDPNAKGANLMTGAGEVLNITNVPLSKIIVYAYGIRDFQLAGGPGWITSARYDITAKPPRGEMTPGSDDPKSMTDDQRKVRNARLRERMRSLLAERFGLVVHHEAKEQTVYSLVVAKNGPKLTAVVTPGEREGISVNTGHVQGFAASMNMLATQLADATRRPVTDETNLSGKYDFLLEWTPDGPLTEGTLTEGTGDARTTGPSIFTAVQEQLGLRLKEGTGPMDVIVIDRVDRPSAN